MNWHDISWMAPRNSIFFLIFLAAMVLLAYRILRLFNVIGIVGKPVHGLHFLHGTSKTRVTTKAFLWATGFFFLFITLLHPCWNKKEEKAVQEGRDLFIALDISRSMLAQDVTPNRLAFAKEKIRSIAQALHSERLGLILFSGSSFIQCPLTKDTSAFLLYLDQIDSDTIGSGKTSIAEAVTCAMRAFQESGTKKSKLLIILTDGEDFSSDLSALKAEAHKEGLTIFTIGVGTSEGAPIALFDAQGKVTGHLRDKNGTVIISSLNQEVLQNLAHELGGIYLHATPNVDDLSSLIKIVEQKEKERLAEQAIAQLEEQYPYFLFISFIFFAIEWLI